MRLHILLLAALILAAPVVAQHSEEDLEQNLFDNGESKIGSSWGMNIQISTGGFVLGAVYNRKVAPKTFLITSLDMYWVNGENEQMDFYTGRTINGENILMVPLIFSVKRRVFADDLSNTLRPFVTVGAGGVWGWYIDGELSDRELLEKYPDHKESQVSLAGLAGIGADFGKPGYNSYGVDIKYQLLRFANHLGQRKIFDNLQLGFHMTF